MEFNLKRLHEIAKPRPKESIDRSKFRTNNPLYIEIRQLYVLFLIEYMHDHNISKKRLCERMKISEKDLLNIYDIYKVLSDSLFTKLNNFINKNLKDRINGNKNHKGHR